MERCPTCGTPVKDLLPKCEAAGCPNTAELEGWYRRIDPVLLKPTGLIQLRKVCGDHKHLLIGGQTEGGQNHG